MSSLNISTNGTNTTDGDDHFGDGYDADYYGSDYDWVEESFVPTLVFLPVANLIGFWGLIGNVCVLIVMRHASLSSVSYSVYLRFLAVSDTALLFARLFESTLFRLEKIDSVLPASDTVCRAHGFFDSWVSQLSPWLVVCLTVDRFIAVTYPLQRKRVCTKKNAFITCIGVTAFQVIYNAVSVPAMIMSPNGFFCTLVQGFEWLDLFSFLANSILPCILIFILNMHILYKIRVSSRERRGLTGNNPEGGVVIAVVDANSPVVQTSKDCPVDGPSNRNEIKGGACDVVESLQSGSGSSASFGGGTRSSFLESVTEEGVDTKNINLGATPCNFVESFPGQDGESDGINVGGPKRVFEDSQGINVGDTRISFAGSFPGEGVDRKDSNDGVTAAGDEGIFRKQPGESSVNAKDQPQKTTTDGNDVDNKTAKHITDKDKTFNSKASSPGPQSREKSQKKTPQKVNTKKSQNRVDRATISLTYVSLSAFLTLAPYALLRGLFMYFLQEHNRQLQEDPNASVPANLTNINRCWDLLELIYLLNFGQNFYILLATNRQVVKAAKETLCFCCTKK